MLSMWIQVALAVPPPTQRIQTLGIADVKGIAAEAGVIYALDPTRHRIRRWLTSAGAWQNQSDLALADRVGNPRGLAAAHGAVWTLGGGGRLWRIDPDTERATSVPMGLDTGELYDLAWHGDTLFVVGRDGIVRIEAPGGRLSAVEGATPHELVLTIPPNTPARSLTVGTVEGHPYLITGAGPWLIVNDLRTGRGLFHVPWEGSDFPLWGVAADGDALWVADRQDNAKDQVRTVSLSTLDAPRKGPQRVRSVHLQTTSDPNRSASGWVTHAYGHPAMLPSQKPLPDRTQRWDRSGGANVTNPTFRIARGVQQQDTIFRWDGRAAQRQSALEAWAVLRDVEHGIYPHRTTRDDLPDPVYIQDTWLHGLDHDREWDAFHARVRSYVQDRYGLTNAQVNAELEIPYWLARDTIEYIFAAYLYPNSELGIDVPQDRERGVFHGHPAYQKAALSAGPHRGDEILACNGSNVLMEGALRSRGIGTRLLGSVFGRAALGPWDTDGDGFIDPGERQPGVIGHQFGQVWMGRHYGWQVFDATPEAKSDARKSAPPPPTPWSVMLEAAATLHRRRIVLTVFSGPHEPMIRNHVPSIAGVEQAYGFFGRYETPAGWQYPKHVVSLGNPLGIDATARWQGDRIRVSWTQSGPWSLIDDPRLKFRLEGWRGNQPSGDVHRRDGNVRLDASAISIDPPPQTAGVTWRVVVELVGDSDTGSRTAPVVR